jgi:hypothetical protein
VLAQRLKMIVADGGRCARDLVGKMDYSPVLFVKEFAAMIETQCLDLLGSDANPLRRSGMGGGSILASVDQRGFQIGELFVTRLQSSGAGNRRIKRQEILEHFGLVGHQSEKDRHVTEVLFHALENRFQIVRRFFFR